MEFKTKKQKQGYEIEITLTAADWEKAVNDAYNANAHKYNVQGFRKGKAPRKVIEQNYGAEIFSDEGLRFCFPQAYMEVLKAHTDIKPIDYPEITTFEDTADGGKKIIAVIDIEPEFTLGRYTGLEIKKATHKVSDKDVEETIQSQAKMRARQVAADKTHAIAIGDIAVIDFVGKLDDVAFESGTAKNHELEIGSHSFIDNFEDQLVGMKIGENKNINVTFPKEYHAANLAGKPVVFEITLNNILLKETPAIDDAFARDVSEFENLADYKKNVRETLEKEVQEKNDNENKNALLKAIVEGTKIDVPEKMIESQLENIMQDLTYRLGYQGLDLETYAKYIGTTAGKIREEQRKNAELSAKSRLVFDAIMDTEKIEVSIDKANEEMKNTATASGKREKDMESDSRQLEYMAQNMRLDKMVKFLLENNKFI
jgi:trigger factor